jgi:hypothetical protein
MNERIREIEKQCWSHRIDGALVDGHLHFDTKKFAELIVRECMNICRYHPSGIVSNNWRADDVAQDIMRQFEEHFGVEE